MKVATVLSLTLALLAAAVCHLASGAVICSQCASVGYQPVCANGQSYENYCYAQCNGATQYTFGLCDSTRSGNYQPNYPYYNSRSGYPYDYNNYYRSGYNQYPYNDYRGGYNQYPYNYYRGGYNQYPYNYGNRNGGVSNCNCPATYSPVCAYSAGSNTRNTYLNSCVATCLGASGVTNGFCY